ncbi:hypothetical protein KQY27_03345 [Methanobrevibacter sp. TMH8]|uniref:hypothetical protein n=1 Tax=Methanobrevibacter sp. TMH8 TaxID=2848611 RepID=UPI001CCC1A39|nr:hypothetical protein [Methanobrevibacter sp. TMH8]MBZ9570580.1 hypothetical protein [Methanobrevibacter sp. TMH8]
MILIVINRDLKLFSFSIKQILGPENKKILLNPEELYKKYEMNTFSFINYLNFQKNISESIYSDNLFIEKDFKENKKKEIMNYISNIEIHNLFFKIGAYILYLDNEKENNKKWINYIKKLPNDYSFTDLMRLLIFGDLNGVIGDLIDPNYSYDSYSKYYLNYFLFCLIENKIKGEPDFEYQLDYDKKSATKEEYYYLVENTLTYLKTYRKNSNIHIMKGFKEYYNSRTYEKENIKQKYNPIEKEINEICNLLYQIKINFKY